MPATVACRRHLTRAAGRGSCSCWWSSSLWWWGADRARCVVWQIRQVSWAHCGLPPVPARRSAAGNLGVRTGVNRHCTKGERTLGRRCPAAGAALGSSPGLPPLTRVHCIDHHFGQLLRQHARVHALQQLADAIHGGGPALLGVPARWGEQRNRGCRLHAVRAVCMCTCTVGFVGWISSSLAPMPAQHVITRLPHAGALSPGGREAGMPGSYVLSASAWWEAQRAPLLMCKHCTATKQRTCRPSHPPQTSPPAHPAPAWVDRGV